MKTTKFSVATGAMFELADTVSMMNNMESNEALAIVLQVNAK
jgi:hypothetical protein